MQKREFKGVAIGVYHPPGSFRTAEEARIEISSNPFYLSQYNNAVEEMKTLPKNSLVLIETPQKSLRFNNKILEHHQFFSLLAKKAKKLGLKVKPFNTVNSIVRRQGAYRLAKLALLANSPHSDSIRSEAESRLKGATNLNPIELDERLDTSGEIMTNQLIKNMILHKPALVIGGEQHITELKKWFIGYSDKTPMKIRLKGKVQSIAEFLFIRNRSLTSRIKEHRRRIIQRHPER
ncbi:MAG: hypothetical protein AABY04_00510 [Candidatus Micrarchaeota archaeon]